MSRDEHDELEDTNLPKRSPSSSSSFSSSSTSKSSLQEEEDDDDGDQDDDDQDDDDDNRPVHMVFTTDLTSMTRLDGNKPKESSPRTKKQADNQKAQDSGLKEQITLESSDEKKDSQKNQDSSAIKHTQTDSSSKTRYKLLGLAALVLLGIVAAYLAQAPNSFLSRDMSVEQIYKKALKSTVKVSVVSTIANEISTGSGSGFVIQPGIVVTNNHVIEGEEKVPVEIKGKKALLVLKRVFKVGEVKLPKDGASYKIESILGSDKKNDIALLYVPGLKAEPLSMRDHKDLKIGETVHTFGNPGILEAVLNSGTISFDGLQEVHGGYYIQHNAPMAPGNSGGPLLDNKCRVLGINTLYLGKGLEHGSLNMTVPIRKVIELLEKPRVQSKLEKLQKESQENSGFGKD